MGFHPAAARGQRTASGAACGLAASHSASRAASHAAGHAAGCSRDELTAGRSEQAGEAALTGGLAKFIPWVLALIVLGTLIFGVAYTIRSISQTPNW